MRGLTLHRPWDWAMAHGGKNIENRPWKAWRSSIGERIALHAGKVYSDTGAGFIDGVLGLGRAPLESASRAGVIVATTRVAGWVHCGGHWHGVPSEVAKAALASPWFMGPYGWIVSDTFALPDPVPCQGALGLWKLPLDVEAAVVRQEMAPR